MSGLVAHAHPSSLFQAPFPISSKTFKVFILFPGAGGSCSSALVDVRGQLAGVDPPYCVDPENYTQVVGLVAGAFTC